MRISVEDILCFFLIYAFLGWCMEVVYATVVKGVFVNRGFLSGPVCPIYGFGGIIVILSLSPLADNIFLLFLGSVALTSLLEYITGYILEKVFHEKWWDYSDTPYNVKGYICLKFSLIWGFVCVFVIDLIHPMIEGLVHGIPDVAQAVILSLAYCLLAADLAVTVSAILKLRRNIGKIEELEKGLRMLSDGIGGKISDGVLVAMKHSPEFEERLAELERRYKRIVEQREGRLLKAFPNLAKIKRNEPLERIKKLMFSMYDDIKEKKAELSGTLKRTQEDEESTLTDKECADVKEKRV